MHELVTPETLAAELGVTEKTLGRWRADHTGPQYVKLGIGGRTSPVRYRRSDVNEWIDGLEVRQ